VERELDQATGAPAAAVADQRRPDVLCVQETKLTDDAFRGCSTSSSPAAAYAVAHHGEPRWNGVAILSRARWSAAARRRMVCGDMNIAPTDADVFDPDAYLGQTHVTAQERAALADLAALGLRDVVRHRWPTERVFTYWDYRAGMFPKDLGMRIDLVLATAPVAGRVRAAWVDRHARKGSAPSDHAPVVVDLDEAPDGDIGPVVPPSSAPGARRGAVKLPQAR